MEDSVAALSLEKVKDTSARLKVDGIEAEQIRSDLERCLRLKAFSIGVQSIQDVDTFLQFAISLAKEEMCSKTMAVQLLQDLFDVNSIRRCEELFDILENNIVVFKTPLFFDSCKNMILRMCNDLLKRLSRTVDTSFCGRILILLARSLPLNEKSGLNLPGQFNVANLTSYEKQEKVDKIEEPEEDNEMEVGEIRETKDASVNFDYGLYTKFWEIQSFFCNPNSVYEAASFTRFESLLSDALNIFSTYKLERPSLKAQLKERSISTLAQNGTKLNGFYKVKSEENAAEQKPSCSTSDVAAAKEDNFFAKYLTNQKLFNLQLADSQFRRYFLVQALILTNYLLNKAKLKESFNSLTQSQENFLKEVTDKCHALLKETYPQGAHFADSVRRTLGREKMWSNWKSEGCPDLIASLVDSKTQLFKKRPVKRYDPSTIDLGNKELTRLWNIAPDNLSACMDKKRNCVPQLKQFIDDGLDELDPTQEVEEQYRSVNDEKYQWMASRFLLYNSDHYMNCVNTDPKAPRQTTAKFLEKATQMTALFMPELKEKAENIQLAIAKKKSDEEAERIRVAEEQETKLKEEAEAAMRRSMEEDQKRKKLEEEQKRKLQEEEKKRLKAQEEEQKHRLAEEEQKRRQLIESQERKKQESQNKKQAAEESIKNKAVKEEIKEPKRKAEEIIKRRVKIPGEKSPQLPPITKDKERHQEVEKHEINTPMPTNKSMSKSKRSSNADTPSSIDDRDSSPAVPPKKLRDENNYKRTKEIRQPTNNLQSTPILSTNTSHSRRSNGQDNVKHISSRSEKKKT